MVYAGTFFEVK